MQPVHAGLLLRRGRRRPCAVSSRQAQQQDGSRVRRWCLPVSFGCWAPTGSDFPIPCPSDFLCQSCPSPGMRVSHALHRVCASVMPLTGYARQSCPSPGMRVSHALHKGMRVSHALHKGMRVSHALHRVCSSVMLPAFPSSQTQLLRSSSAPMRRSAGAARGNVTAMRRPAGLGSTICLATTRCKSPGKSTGSSA